MANENVKIIRLQKTITDLTADNNVLSNGQQVFVTGITDSVNIVTKLGDGTTSFNSIPFFDTIKIETGSAYDVTQAFLSIDGNEIEITATSDIVVTTDTDPIDIISGQTIRLRRISGTWVTLAAGGAGAQVAGTLGETIGANTLVYFDTLGNLMIGDNRYLSQSVLAGFLVKAGVLNDNRLVQSGGILDGFTGLSIGTQYYLGHSGSLLTSAAIAFNEYIVSVGVAVSATEIDVAIRLPEPVRNQDDSVPIGAIQSFATYKDRTGQGYRVFDYDNALSQANFPILFTEIGHKFNQAHVDAGDVDLSASTTLFYPTPPPSFYSRAGIPDSASIDSTSAIDIATDIVTLSASDYNRFKRMKFNTDSYNGVPAYLSGTLPAGLLESTLYFLRFTDDANYYTTLHPTEKDAIENTNVVDITATATGTFVLTQEGIALDDSLQGHFHDLSGNQLASNAIGGNLRLTTGDVNSGSDLATSSYKAKTLITDGTNGTPRTTNETRPKTSILFYYIKAENVLTAGEPLSSLRYSETITGTVWNNQLFTINHGLSEETKNLIVKVEINRDGSFDWQEVDVVMDGALAGTYGLSKVDSGSLSSFGIQTGNIGLLGIDAAGNRIGLSDTSTGGMRVLVIKPNLITTVSDISAGPKVVDLTSVDYTYTLPTGIGNGFVQDIFWSNGGTYKLTMATSDGSTVGGLTAGTWLGEGEGNMTVIYDSANNDWKVREYGDYLEFNSTNDDQYVWKGKDGTEKQLILTSINIAIDTASGSLYRTPTVTLGIVRSHNLITLLFENSYIYLSEANSICWIVKSSASDGRGTILNTAQLYLVDAVSIAAQNYTIGQEATGRWRA